MTVTTITGFDLDDNALNVLSKQIKQHCETEGSVKMGRWLFREIIG
jgi:translation initiation factor 1 (eIF-1/SUI1)